MPSRATSIDKTSLIGERRGILLFPSFKRIHTHAASDRPLR
ncbi:hypothetical protein DB31_1316 [Hyalangium minutum]|uniref:Uncharacterized protein n=1 Tax=Hyalangium minutum TaxID=394096 RepID=A0A085WEY8_9BACT|nr:hypothetical protein DB31_1316 [Hyalangium minutum]